jgi:hypothetical protein
MASLEELYNKSEISKKVANKVDRTPISAGDFELDKLSVTEEQLAKALNKVRILFEKENVT